MVLFRWPITSSVEDFNNDARLDLVLVDANIGAVVLLLGSGNGSFTEPIRYIVTCSPRNVAVADLNSDKQLDVVLPH